MITHTVKRAYKFRFYPTNEQASLLARSFGCARVVYNKGLEVRRDAWENDGVSVSYNDTAKLLTQWKRTEEYSYLREVSNVVLQQSLKNLDAAYQRFFKKQNNYPRFKSRRGKQSIRLTSNGFRFDVKRRSVTLAKMREPLDIVWSRTIPKASRVSSVTVSCDTAGRYFISMLTEVDVVQKAPVAKTVGLDLGVHDTVITSDGEKIANPRFTQQGATRIAKLQRTLSRKQKGSRNRKKVQRKLARAHAHITDSRRDHLHKLSSTLIDKNHVIVLEDLQVKAMMSSAQGTQQHPGKNVRQKAGMNRAIADVGWGELRSMLEYKAAWCGRELIVIDKWFPSTQLCSDCGDRSGPTGRTQLNVRSWTCSKCNSHHDRDVNAARNILAAGLAVAVCGDSVSQ